MPDTHVFLVPGYVVRPQRYGTDWFLPVAADLPETDLQGHSSGRGTAFRGRKGTKNWFHFPITNPTILSDGRLSCNLAAVTLELENEKAFIEAMHLWDRTNRVANFDGLNFTGNLGDKWIEGQNMFQFRMHEVGGPMGISVLIHFRDEATVLFTGAALRFRTPP